MVKPVSGPGAASQARLPSGGEPSCRLQNEQPSDTASSAALPAFHGGLRLYFNESTPSWMLVSRTTGLPDADSWATFALSPSALAISSRTQA